MDGEISARSKIRSRVLVEFLRSAEDDAQWHFAADELCSARDEREIRGEEGEL
jgi:hypothetical protein